jgi:competence ComEA-like helix-hairpin-helix protein
MKWQEFVRDYFAFTRKERIGILVVLALIFVIFLFPKINGAKTGKTPNFDTAWVTAIKKMEIKDSGHEVETGSNNEDFAYQYDRNESPLKKDLFNFDPNILSAEDWKKLGLREKTISTIQNYISKGGRFKKREDLQKIYGLQKDEYKRLSPYIKIETTEFVKEYGGGTSLKNTSESKNPAVYTSRYPTIDINTSDTLAFISLPGIGSKLAARIVNFREKLGGFYSVEQIGETYGLPDSTFQKIKQYLKLENSSVRKININTVTVDELKAHPYIKYSIANPIVAYRNEHGPFSKPEDLKKVMAVTEDVYKKISPYLTVH